MAGLTKENLNALDRLMGLPVVENEALSEIIVNCGGCTSLHHNN